jgi:serine/threonine protein kinase
MPSIGYLRTGLQPFPGYSLEQRLGTGAFGEVWQATAPQGRVVALKFLPCDPDAATAREIRSLQAIVQLQHPNLIRTEHLWTFQGCVVVAMEMADGSLADLLDMYQSLTGAAVVPEHACLLFAEAADALDFLNARIHLINGRQVAIQHCDIKPKNLLLMGDTLKVADFGLATLMTANLETRGRAGTLEYCAPEVFNGLVSNHTDQYALAVSYCLIRGGRPPFRDTPSSFDSRYTRPRPDLDMLTVPERSLIARALDPVPQNRWPSCKALMSRLSRIFCETGDPRAAKGKSGLRRIPHAV